MAQSEFFQPWPVAEQAAVPGFTDETAVPTEERTTLLQRLVFLQAVALLAIAHVLMAGYRMGVGNQTIQIPFLKKAVDSSLFTNDPTVQGTVKDYPSFFFKALSLLTRAINLESVYFGLHLLTAFGVLLGIYAVAKAIFKDSLAGIIAMALLFAGHHHALAGDEMYSLGFTHTWAVFPLAIFSIALLYREKLIPAFLLAGFIFNLHALTAAYLFVMFAFWVAFEYRRLGWFKVVLLFALFALVASPMALIMAAQHQTFDATWLTVTRMRSADHSFPLTWWQPGNPDLPRFLVILGLGAVSISFAAPAGQMKKTLLMAAGALLLFWAGVVFVESRWPLKVAVRAQLFRVSRLLMVIVMAHIAYGIACGLRRESKAGEPVWRGWLELLSAIVTLLCMAVPSLVDSLPWALALAIGVALANGRLSWPQACIAGPAMLAAFVAWLTIDFRISGPLAGASALIDGLKHGLPEPSSAFVLALACGVALMAAARMAISRNLKVGILVESFIVCMLLVAMIARPLKGQTGSEDAWVDVQHWAAANSPKDAVFLTPPRQSGFRIHSDRAVVGEWRDGTQAYFTGAFAADWSGKMKSLQPGLLFDESGKRVLSHGQALAALADERLLSLAREYGATYIVLPTTDSARGFNALYVNPQWTVYEAKLDLPPDVVKTHFPDGIVDRALWLEQQDFIQNVALPNIEKYRKGDTRIEVIDASGKPLHGAAFIVKQTKHHFGFGCSLPFFEPVEGRQLQDHKPAPVTETELKRFQEIFNFSVIPFSGKWFYIEPRQGERHYDDLDKYVDWCVKHGVEMEYHFVAGLTPAWLNRLDDADQSEALKSHALQLFERYHDKIKYWQLTNSARMLDAIPATYEAVHNKYPDTKLGISSCTMFMANSNIQQMRRQGGGGSMFRGEDDMADLKEQGIQLDFYSLHAHYPRGNWPEARSMYKTLDMLAKFDVKLHISEWFLGDPPMSGTFASARYYTPEAKADFFEYYYTVCFSHPAVEAINYWAMGNDTLEPQMGLLDRNMEPKPVFYRLKHLIQEKWKTNLNGTTTEAGGVSFRGFHGEYEITVTLPSGKTAKGVFAIRPDQLNRYRFKANESAGTLEAVELTR